MFCPNCGAQLPDGSKFCGSCGAKLNTTVQREPVKEVMAEREPVYPRASSQKKKGPPVVLFVFLAVILVAAGVIAYFVHQSALEKAPLHGAKIKKQTVWETDGGSVTVTGIDFDEEYNYRYPYIIGLEGNGVNITNLECGLAANGVHMDTLMSERGILVTKRYLSDHVSFDRIAEIDLVLKNKLTGKTSDVIHLTTGLKKPDLHLKTDEDELYNANGIRVMYHTVYPMYRDDGPGLEFYMENKTSSVINVRITNVSVKGVPVVGTAQGVCLPEKVGYFILELNTADMEQKGVLPMSDVTVTLVFENYATGETLYTAEATIPWL